MNKVIICGNLGADPESRSTSTGLSVCNLRVATTERVKKGDEWGEHTEWHRVVCFGKTAENVARYLTKGRKVLIEGKNRTSSYEKDGVKRYSTDIIADQVHFIGGREDSGSGGGGGRENYSEPGPDDDIPF